MKDLSPEKYLDKNYDYNRLTKTELRKILLENNVNVKASALKQELLLVYKTNIYDKIDELRQKLDKAKNVFQKSRSSIIDIDLNEEAGQKVARGSVFTRSTTTSPVKNTIRNLSVDQIDMTTNNNHKSIVNRHTLSPARRDSTKHTLFVKADITKKEDNAATLNRTNEQVAVQSDIADGSKTTAISTGYKTFVKTATPDVSLSLSKPIQSQNKSNNSSALINTDVPMLDARENNQKEDTCEKSMDERVGNTSMSLSTVHEKGHQPDPSFLSQDSSLLDASFNFSSDILSRPASVNDEHDYSRSTSHLRTSAKERLRELIAKDQKCTNTQNLSQVDANVLLRDQYINSSFAHYSDASNSNVEYATGHNSMVAKKSTWKILWRLLIICVVCIIYYVIKTMPYCNGNNLLCVPLPARAVYKNGQVVCAPGFVYKKSVLRNYCRKDDSVRKITQEIIRRLEIQHGDYLFGQAKAYKVPVFRLSTDPKVIYALSIVPHIKIVDGLMYSEKYRVSVRTFLQFYCKKIACVLLPLLVIIIFFKFWQVTRRRRKQIDEKAKAIYKDVLLLLSRQLAFATSNNRFPEYVYIDQLCDMYGEDKKVWEKTKEKVNSNSNVSTYKVDGRDVWHWVGPFIQDVEGMRAHIG